MVQLIALMILIRIGLHNRNLFNKFNATQTNFPNMLKSNTKKYNKSIMKNPKLSKEGNIFCL